MGAMNASQMTVGRLWGQTGGGADQFIVENDYTVTADFTIGTNHNAVSGGPVTVNSGVTVTVPSGSVWTVV
jgi:hypothetical protein